MTNTIETTDVTDAMDVAVMVDAERGGKVLSAQSAMHYGLEQPKIQTAVLGHSLVRSLIRLHRSLIHLLRTA